MSFLNYFKLDYFKTKDIYYTKLSAYLINSSGLMSLGLMRSIDFIYDLNELKSLKKLILYGHFMEYEQIADIEIKCVIL